MKRSLLIVTLWLGMGTASFSQSKTRAFYDSARAYFEKKDFKNAFRYYDAYYSDSANGQSNYDTYFTAIAACYAGDTAKATYYLKRSAEIGYDLSSYGTFAHDTLNACLHSLPEWKIFISDFKRQADSEEARLSTITQGMTDTSLRVNGSLLTDRLHWEKLAAGGGAKALLAAIRRFNDYPFPRKTGFWTLYHIKVNDSLDVPFLLYIPRNYDPSRRTALYVFLHGAVSGRKQFTSPAYVPDKNGPLLKRAFDQNAFVLYPFAKKDFGWLFQQQAFETILREIGFIKGLYNINDDKVYLGGHSDGGRGAFWFALNQPNSFAACYGINYFPSLYTGNTPLRNLRNELPFFGISGNQDELFNIGIVDSIKYFAARNGARWTNFSIPGGHGLPYDSPDSIYFLFDTLIVKSRNPFPNHVEWETDNVKNGRYAWIAINELDTLSPSSWRDTLNPLVPGKNGLIHKVDFNKNRVGLIKASIKDNTVYLETVQVKAFTFYVFPELIDTSKPVQIFVNGKRIYSGKMLPDSRVILDEFMEKKDRIAIPVHKFYYRLD